MNKGFSVSLKLAMLVAAALGLLVVVAWTGQRALANMQSSTRQVVDHLTMLKNQMQLDMIHDAVRSDVALLALSASQKDLAQQLSASQTTTQGGLPSASSAPGELIDGVVSLSNLDAKAVRGALDRHGKEMLELVTTLSREDVPADIRVSISSTKPVVQNYVRLAHQVGDLVGKDPLVTQAALTDFESGFLDLEKRLGGLGDSIKNSAFAIQAASSKTAQEGTNLIYLTGLLAFALLMFVSWLIARSIVGPLKRAIKAAQAVAAGD